MAENKPTVVMVRRVKKITAGGHHGGSWKVAYADFVTAMMAFFLVMWLVGATTNKERAAISEYFRNPSPLTGKSFSPAPGPNGPGGASTSMIQLGGAMDIPRGNGDDAFAKGDGKTDGDSEEQKREQDKRRLESLMEALEEAIGKSQALEPFKDQLLLDITPEGLRIQIVDQQNRPMFDIGRSQLKPYTNDILRELSGFINQVPNAISITGHTDTTLYAGTRGYTNWELSADRANAARRALIDGGMHEDKVSRVVGLSSSVLFDKANPQNPINRRISIVVMTRAALDATLQQSELPVALGPRQSDADLRMPDAPLAAAMPVASATTPAAVHDSAAASGAAHH